MRFFTPAEDKFLRQNFKRLNTRQLSEALSRCENSVNKRMRYLGLHRPLAVRLKMQAEGYFKPGHVPFNKDKKGIHLSPATEFKKGHLPANTKHDGCIVVRVHKRSGVPYRYIRVKKAHWVLLHRYNWEKRFGKIPPRHIIGFKDRNTLNCRLKNLYLMSKADNARRNINYQKAAISIRRAWAAGRHFQSDNYIAWTLSVKNPALRETLKSSKSLLALKRLQLQLRRQIHVTTHQEN